MLAGAADFWSMGDFSGQSLFCMRAPVWMLKRWAPAPALSEDHFHKQSFLLINKSGQSDAVLLLRGVDSLVCFSIIFINWKKAH